MADVSGCGGGRRGWSLSGKAAENCLPVVVADQTGNRGVGHDDAAGKTEDDDCCHNKEDFQHSDYGSHAVIRLGGRAVGPFGDDGGEMQRGRCSDKSSGSPHSEAVDSVESLRLDGMARQRIAIGAAGEDI